MRKTPELNSRGFRKVWRYCQSDILSWRGNTVRGYSQPPSIKLWRRLFEEMILPPASISDITAASSSAVGATGSPTLLKQIISDAVKLPLFGLSKKQQAAVKPILDMCLPLVRINEKSKMHLFLRQHMHWISPYIVFFSLRTTMFTVTVTT